MIRVQAIGIITSVFLFVLVLELVRRRELREEYSWLWLAAATGYLILAIAPVRMLEWTAGLIGAEKPVSAFTFLAFLFLFLICIQFSMRLSRLTNRNKHLAQHIAILDSEIKQLRERVGLDSAETTLPELELNSERNAPVKQQEIA